jgi:hypothetical protein
MKKLDWTKIDSPLPVKEINKGHVVSTPLSEAYNNAGKVVSSKLEHRPIPAQGILPIEG